MASERHIKNLLKAYHIVPRSISTVTKRVYKVTDASRTYAVKRSHLRADTTSAWQLVYDLAYTHGLKQVLPVYLTYDGYLFREMEDGIYYVTPWIEESQASQENIVFSLYTALGQIHESTKKTADVELEVTQTGFRAYEQMLNDAQDRLLGYIDLFEQQHFMSPFELQVCTHFGHIDHIFNTISHKLHNFMASLTTDAAQTVSLCHGQLSCDHFIYRHEGFFINWEKAGYAHPMQDVSELLHQIGRVHRTDKPLWIEGLDHYFNVYHETQNDRLLLSLYLLDPLPYIQLIERHIGNTTSDSMLKITEEMEQEFRKLHFAVKVTEQLEQLNESQSNYGENPIEI